MTSAFITLGFVATIYFSALLGRRAARRLRFRTVTRTVQRRETVVEDLWGEARWTARDLLRR
jgi:hypothetical protein